MRPSTRGPSTLIRRPSSRTTSGIASGPSSAIVLSCTRDGVLAARAAGAGSTVGGSTGLAVVARAGETGGNTGEAEVATQEPTGGWNTEARDGLTGDGGGNGDGDGKGCGANGLVG